MKFGPIYTNYAFVYIHNPTAAGSSYRGKLGGLLVFYHVNQDASERCSLSVIPLFCPNRYYTSPYFHSYTYNYFILNLNIKSRLIAFPGAQGCGINCARARQHHPSLFCA